MRRYLIVDDNRPLAENLAEIVNDSGATSEIASSGIEALRMVRVEKFDLLITDMRMPEVGGAELLRRIREVDPGLPVIVVTAYTTDDDLGLACRFGLLGVLPKPAPLSRLLELARMARRDAVVAIVEDDRALAENLSEMLQLAGFATIVATSLEIAQHLQTKPFAALVDLRFPGEPDGVGLSMLREQFSDMPILVITGHANLLVGDEARVFIKPFAMDSLLAALAKLHEGLQSGDGNGRAPP